MWEGDHGELEVAGMRIPTTHAVCNQAGPQTPLIAQAQVWWYNADGEPCACPAGAGLTAFSRQRPLFIVSSAMKEPHAK